MKKATIIASLIILVFYPLFTTPTEITDSIVNVQVDSYVQLSEDKSIRETRQLAYANARRLALENAMTYVSSSTEVENFQVRSDLIETMAEGLIEVTEMKDHGIENNSRYHVWLKAEITPQNIHKLIKPQKKSHYQHIKQKK